jgi:hypothetical protein
MKIDGRCHCGYVTFEAEADPETTTICSCTDYQTMSGAPLRAVIITRPGTFVLLSGKPTEYRKTADSGNVSVQGFCPHCGTAALYATSVGDEPKTLQLAPWIAKLTKSIGATQADICSLAAGMGERPHLDREIRWHPTLTQPSSSSCAAADLASFAAVHKISTRWEVLRT